MSNVRKRDIFCGEEETLEETCRRISWNYQRRFGDVPPALSSEEFLEHFAGSKEKVVLVDCRTEPERQVSIIEGAVPLREFEKETIPKLPRDVQVVTYCTIGYRSSMEGRRLNDMYGLDGRIQSLDGIVAYTHVLSKHRENTKQYPGIVDASGKPTAAVHTFGSMWSCAQDDYEATYYSLPVLLVRMVQVGGVSVVRTVQHLLFVCHCRKRPTQREDE